jgi:hypothetical protein
VHFTSIFCGDSGSAEDAWVLVLELQKLAYHTYKKKVVNKYMGGRMTYHAERGVADLVWGKFFLTKSPDERQRRHYQRSSSCNLVITCRCWVIFQQETLCIIQSALGHKPPNYNDSGLTKGSS